MRTLVSPVKVEVEVCWDAAAAGRGRKKAKAARRREEVAEKVWEEMGN